MPAASVPQVIFLDAVGTLFGVTGSVGEQYVKVASRFGVHLSPDALNQAFYKSFKAAAPPAFSGTEAAEIQVKEYTWWLELAVETFQAADAFHHFPDFGRFFAHLYDYFATAEPWFVYPDAIAALKQWQQLGIPLGILSNFDSRLYSVLKALNLADYFTSVTISTEAGAAKPNPKIFEIALQKHNCPPSAAWHIGDSFEEDYQAAKAVGLRGIWLRRR
jgi:putative hydrolase of the HAD superfamily